MTYVLMCFVHNGVYKTFPVSTFVLELDSICSHVIFIYL